MNIIVVNHAAHNVVIAGNLTEQQKAYLAEESRRGSAHYTCVTFNYYEDEDRTLVKFILASQWKTPVIMTERKKSK